MSQQPKARNRSAECLADILVRIRARAGLTQAKVAAQMATTQTAIARLESGQQSPSIPTLLSYARANGYCLEIAFIRSSEAQGETGCVLLIED